MNITWEVRFKGERLLREIVAADFESALKLIRQLAPNKEIVYLQHLD